MLFNKLEASLPLFFSFLIPDKFWNMSENKNINGVRIWNFFFEKYKRRENNSLKFEPYRLYYIDYNLSKK